MAQITFNQAETDRLVSNIKEYFSNELNQDIGAFDAQFLIDFFIKEIGPALYNQGIQDAHRLFSERSEELGYLIQELEQT